MSRTSIDVIVTCLLFVSGVTWTVYTYAKRDRLAFAMVAILAPLLAVLSLIRVAYLVITSQVKIGPCPDGLAEAEVAVEQERQRLFGGDLRTPTLAASWQRAYELELQREAERVQRIAQRYLVHA